MDYSYEIVSVDENARVMEIVYTADGRQPIHVGARLPYVGETIEQIVDMFSPVRYWQERDTQVVVPEVGIKADFVRPTPPPPTPEQIQKKFEADIQQRLDAFASTKNYDNILSACTYATSDIPKFAAEGQYCVNARDATWAKAYEILAEVQTGTRPMPTSIADIEADLPVLAWPA